MKDLAFDCQTSLAKETKAASILCDDFRSSCTAKWCLNQMSVLHRRYDAANIEIKVISRGWFRIPTNARMRTALSPRTTQRPFHIYHSQRADQRLPHAALPNKITAGIASTGSLACSFHWWNKSLFSLAKQKEVSHALSL